MAAGNVMPAQDVRPALAVIPAVRTVRPVPQQQPEMRMSEMSEWERFSQMRMVWGFLELGIRL